MNEDITTRIVNAIAIAVITGLLKLLETALKKAFTITVTEVKPDTTTTATIHSE